MSEFGVDWMSPGGWLPLVFALVMALSMLAYVILDGYDLGVGALLDSADTLEQKDIMIASLINCSYCDQSNLIKVLTT